MGSMLKSFFRSMWGVNEPPEDLTPAIQCEPCRVARTAGKDACPEHHTHHDRAHPNGRAPEI
jgi:hypothetical protein